MERSDRPSPIPAVIAVGALAAGASVVAGPAHTLTDQCDKATTVACPTQAPEPPDNPHREIERSPAPVATAMGADGQDGSPTITPGTGALQLQGYPPSVRVGPQPLGGPPF